LMSENIEYRGPDGALIGTQIHVSSRRPTKQSSSHHLDPTDPEVLRLLSHEGYAAAQVAEYGIYVAVVPIVHNGVRAYNVGHPVPVSNVEKYGYLEQGLVRAVGEPVPPVASTPPVLHLSVRCGRQILGVYGNEPAILLGYFVPDALRLVGKTAVLHGADLELAYIRAGRDPSELVAPIIAGPGTPLQIWCPGHRGGHDVDVGLLRTELVKADGARIGKPWCPVERIVAAD